MLSLAVMMYRSFLSVIFATNLGMVASAFLGQNAAMFKVHLKATPSAMNPEEKINLKRAKDCAEHFGKCSPKEVETLRDGELTAAAAEKIYFYL